MIMEVLGMDVLNVNFSQASMDDAHVLSFPSATSSFMKDVVKTAKVLIKKQDIRIKELEKLDVNESIAGGLGNKGAPTFLAPHPKPKEEGGGGGGGGGIGDVLQQAKNNVLQLAKAKNNEKIRKEKNRKRRETSANVRWYGKDIHLGSNLNEKQVIEKKKSAMVCLNEWKSIQPIPTREWVILELERLGIRKLLNDNTASLSDELKARKEVAEVNILNCLLFLFEHLFLTHPHYLFRPKKHIRL